MEVWNFSKESEKNRRELGRTDICSKLWLQKSLRPSLTLKKDQTEYLHFFGEIKFSPEE